MATLTAIFKAQDSLSNAMTKAGNAGSKATGIVQKLGKIGSVAMKGIVTAVTAAGTALLAFGKKAINVGMNFETSMSQVMATMGIDKNSTFVSSTGEILNSYEVLSAEAEKMGAETAFTSSQAADALNYLALAGYDAEQATAALPTVLHLAGAGGMELSAASDMITDSMAALGMEVNQVNLDKFADQMAKTASTTNTSVSQLGEATLTVGAVAANLKNGTTELNTQLGILANVGIKGAEGGTHLRNVLLRLQNPTDKAAKAMKKLGVEVYDNEGKMRDTGAIFEDMKNSMDGMNQQQIDEVMSTIFNKTDIAAANALLAASGDEYNRIFSIIENSGGAAAEMYQTMLDNLKGDVDIFKSATEALYLALYKSVNGTLRDLVQTGTGYMNRLLEAFKVGGFEGLANEIGLVLGDAVGVIMSYVPSLVSAGANIVVSLVEGIGNNADTFTEAAGDIAESMIGAIIRIGPKLLGALMNIFRAAGQSILRRIPKIFNKIPDRFYKALGLDPKNAKLAISTFTAKLQGALRHLFDGDIFGALGYIGQALGLDSTKLAAIRKGLGNVIGWTKSTFSNMKSAFASGFAEGGLFGGIKSAFESLKTSLAGVDWAGIWDCIKNTASEAYDKIKEVVTDAKDKVVEWFKSINWSGIWDSVKSTVGGLLGKLKIVAATAKAKVVDWFKTVNWAGIWDSIKSTVGSLLGKMKTVAISAKGKVVDWFKTVNWSGIWDSVKSTIGSLLGKMKTVAASAKAKVIDWFKTINWSAIWDGVKNTVGGLLGKLKTVAAKAKNSVLDWFRSVNWSGIWENVKSTLGGLVGKMKTVAASAKGRVVDWFKGVNWSSIWDGVKNTVGGLLGKLRTVAAKAKGKVVDWFKSANWSSIWENVKNTAGGLLGKLKLAAIKAKKQVIDWFKTVDWSGIWENIKSTKDALKTKITEILQSLPEIISGLAEKASSFLSGGTFDGLGDSVITLIKSAITSKAGGGAATIIEAITGLFDGLDLSKLGTQIGEATNGLGNILIDVIDAAFKGATDGSTRLIGAIQGLFEKLLSPDALKGTTETLSSIGSTIIDVIAAAIRGAQGLATSIYQALADLIASISWEDVGLQLGTFASGLVDKIATSISELANSGSIGTMASSFGTLIGNALSAISSAAIGFGKALVNWILSGDVFVTLFNIANALVEALWGFITSAISAIWDNSWIKGKLDEIGDYINGSLSKDVDVGFDWQTPAQDIVQELTVNPDVHFKEGFSPDTINQYLTGLAAGLADGSIPLEDMQFTIDNWTADLGKIGLTEEQIQSSGVMDLVRDMFNSAYGQPVEAEVPVAPEPTIDAAAAAGMADQVRENVLNATEGIDTTAAGTDAGTNFVNAFGATDPTEQVTVLGESLTTAAAAITMDSEGAQVMTTFDTGLNSVKSTIESTARTTGTSIKTILGGVDLYSTGTNVMRGLLRGMLSMFPTLMERARDIARSIKTTIQGALEVASPSKFTTWVGEMTGKGLADGLANMTRKTTAAAAAMALGVTTAFAPMAVATPSINLADIRTPAQVSIPTSIQASVSPYEALVEETEKSPTRNDEKRIVIEINGVGRIDVSGITRQQAMDLIAERIRPELMDILEREIYEGGNGVYDY